MFGEVIFSVMQRGQVNFDVFKARRAFSVAGEAPVHSGRVCHHRPQSSQAILVSSGNHGSPHKQVVSTSAVFVFERFRRDSSFSESLELRALLSS